MAAMSIRSLFRYCGYAYDAIGNPLTDGTWNYTWEKGRQLRRMENASKRVTFTYDANGMRIRKTVDYTDYTYYTYHGKNLVHLKKTGGTDMNFYYDAQNRPSVVNYNGNHYAFTRRRHGSPDNTGTKVVSYSYNAWGKPLYTSGSLASTLGVLNPFRYRGYIYDEETGFYYLRSRYYYPNRCRFINADVVLGKRKIVWHNLYAYCANNCINAVDSLGTEPFDLFQTELDAVYDFAMLYSSSEVEVAAIIYCYKDEYFYGTTSFGNERSATLPSADYSSCNLVTPIAFIHTHPGNVEGTVPYIPSEQDIYSLCAGPYTRSYLAVFDGSVLKMDRGSNEATLPSPATLDEMFTVLLTTQVSALKGPVHDAIQNISQGYIDYTVISSEVYSKKRIK